jgi:hypothetical protein
MFKLGRLKPELAFYDRMPYLDTSKLPAPPASIDWLAKVTEPFGMDGNDRYGDCTIAAVGHTALVLSSNAGAGHQPAEEKLVAAYFDLTGGEDTGLLISEVMKRWAGAGIAGDKIAAFGKLDPADVDQIKQSIATLANCNFGVTLPKFITAGLARGAVLPWQIPADGDMTLDPDGGHCVPGFKYDADGPTVVTWGQKMPASWAFLQAVIEEAWAPVSPDFLAANGIDPAGLNLAALEADLKALLAS